MPRIRRASFIATLNRRTSLSPSAGQVKILDFGLAKLVPGMTMQTLPADLTASDDEALGATRETPLARPHLLLSHTGVAMGTAGYMSPEQVAGREVGRTDRPVFLWIGALRNGDGPGSIQRRDRADAPRCDPESHAGRGARSEFHSFRPSWRRSSRKRWRRTVRSGTSQPQKCAPTWRRSELYHS